MLSYPNPACLAFKRRPIDNTTDAVNELKLYVVVFAAHAPGQKSNRLGDLTLCFLAI